MNGRISSLVNAIPPIPSPPGQCGPGGATPEFDPTVPISNKSANQRNPVPPHANRQTANTNRHPIPPSPRGLGGATAEEQVPPTTPIRILPCYVSPHSPYCLNISPYCMMRHTPSSGYHIRRPSPAFTALPFVTAVAAVAAADTLPTPPRACPAPQPRPLPPPTSPTPPRAFPAPQQRFNRHPPVPPRVHVRRRHRHRRPPPPPIKVTRQQPRPPPQPPPPHQPPPVHPLSPVQHHVQIRHRVRL